MMQQQTGGYLAPSRRNPLGLTLVIAGHVAVLGAIALSPPKFIRERVKDFIVTSIPDEPPPPPEVPPEPAKPQPEAKSVVDTPKAVVESPLTQTIDLATVQVDPPPLPPMPPELPRVETPPSPPQIVDARDIGQLHRWHRRNLPEECECRGRALGARPRLRQAQPVTTSTCRWSG